MSRRIVAFGDSNTRFWLGDTGECGPAEYAWPTQLERMLMALGISGAVRNEGWPGEQADFALAEFGRIARGADICVLGFGTNDIKQLEMTMATYLGEIEGILQKAAGRLPMIVLGIPWFEEDYAGAVAQSRLPKWNAALEELCRSYRVPFVDTYAAFQDAPERWFNERVTPKRHLSAAGQRKLAELVLPHVLGQIRGDR